MLNSVGLIAPAPSVRRSAASWSRVAPPRFVAGQRKSLHLNLGLTARSQRGTITAINSGDRPGFLEKTESRRRWQ